MNPNDLRPNFLSGAHYEYQQQQLGATKAQAVMLCTVWLIVFLFVTVYALPLSRKLMRKIRQLRQARALDFEIEKYRRAGSAMK